MSEQRKIISMLNIVSIFAHKMMMDNYVSESYDALRNKFFTKIESLDLGFDIKQKLKKGVSSFIIALEENGIDIQKRYITIKSFFLNFFRKTIVRSYINEVNRLYNLDNTNRYDVVNLINTLLSEINLILNGGFIICNEKEFRELIKRVYAYGEKGALSALILRTIVSLQSSKLKFIQTNPILTVSILSLIHI